MILLHIKCRSELFGLTLHNCHNYYYRIAKNNYNKTQLRKAQLDEQAAIEEETKCWQEKEREREEKRLKEKVQFKKELDDNLKSKRDQEEERKQQEQAEEEERQIFANAKRVSNYWYDYYDN